MPIPIAGELFDTELPAAVALADALAAPSTPVTGAALLGYNGAAWDRWRANMTGTLLASAVRNASISSPIQTNQNARGVLIIVHIGVAGTGAISPIIRDSFSGQDAQLLLGANITGIGTFGYVVYPGATKGSAIGGHVAAGDITGLPLPRSWYLRMSHSDGSNWTYDVTYALIV